MKSYVSKPVMILFFMMAFFLSCKGENALWKVESLNIEGPVVRNGKIGLNLVAALDLYGLKGKKIEITAEVTVRTINDRIIDLTATNPYIGIVEASRMPYVSLFVPLLTHPDGLDSYYGVLQVYDMSVTPKKPIPAESTVLQHTQMGLNSIYAAHISKLPEETTSPSFKIKQRIPVKVAKQLYQLTDGNFWTYKNSNPDTEARNDQVDAESYLTWEPVDSRLKGVKVMKSSRVLGKLPPFYVDKIRVSKTSNDLVITFDADLAMRVWPKELMPKAGEDNMLGVHVAITDGKTSVISPNGKKVTGFLNMGPREGRNSINDVQVTIPLTDIPQSQWNTRLYAYLLPYINIDGEWERDIWSPGKSFIVNALPASPSPQPQPKPKPTPSVSKPVLTWIQCPATSSGPTLNLKVGVKSGSAITGYKVLVNGSEDRGIKAVRNDGYDLMIDRTVTLARGENRITVSVTNAGGTVEEVRTVTYGSANTPKPSPKPSVVTPSLKKIALVVGNGAYPEQPLRNTLNDASAVAGRLRSLGFEVVYASDASKKQLDRAINDFGSRAARYDVAMFYYAGHGIQHNGENYLVPVDATLHSESDVTYECTNVNRLLDKLEDSGVKMKIVALDACRNNPFERSWHRSAAGSRGLSAINAPVGTFISYATSPGNVAADGSGTHSPYTDALLKALDEKDLSIEGVFRQVGANVTKATGRAQTPWYASSLYEGNFIFNPSK